MMDKICTHSIEDTGYKKLVQQIKDGIMRRYYLKDDFLMASGGRLFVPIVGGLRKEILGRHMTLTRLGI